MSEEFYIGVSGEQHTDTPDEMLTWLRENVTGNCLFYAYNTIPTPLDKFRAHQNLNGTPFAVGFCDFTEAALFKFRFLDATGCIEKSKGSFDYWTKLW